MCRNMSDPRLFVVIVSQLTLCRHDGIYCLCVCSACMANSDCRGCIACPETETSVTQMQFQKRKSDLVVFKDRAEALKQAVGILEEGIAASRAQVSCRCSACSMTYQL